MSENVLVKISGVLQDNKIALTEMSHLGQVSDLTVVPGGGPQINEAFKKAGYKIEFGPFGRICHSFEERQLARDILELNQKGVQDYLRRSGVNARVVMPVIDVSSVLCHVNGDLYALAVSNGFDQIKFFTEKVNVAKKEDAIQRLIDLFVVYFGGIAEPNKKISVVGF